MCIRDRGYVSILPGLGGGSFGSGIFFGLTSQTLGLAVGDLDSDNQPDFALASSAGVFIMTNRGLVGQAIVEGSISSSSPSGKGSGLVSWQTGAELDLRGFNIVTVEASGRRTQINSVMIPCEECITGAGHVYTFIVPKHKGGRNIYVEAIHLNGRLERFGPVSRR